jgi:hypothetical protein
MRKTLAAIFICVLGAACAQGQEVTLDFTGTVANVSGIYSSIPIGSAITGTYTFDFANATQTSGSPGSNPFFAEAGGTTGVPLLSGPVFTATASSAGFSINTGPPVSSGDFYDVTEGNFVAGPILLLSMFNASETYQLGASGAVYENLLNLNGLSPTFDSKGLPVAPTIPARVGSGGFIGCLVQCTPAIDGGIGYALTSISPAVSAVPEASSSVMVIAGLLALTLVMRIRHTRLLRMRVYR